MANKEITVKGNREFNDLSEHLKKKKRKVNIHENKIKLFKRKKRVITEDMTDKFHKARADYQKFLDKEKR